MRYVLSYQQFLENQILSSGFSGKSIIEIIDSAKKLNKETKEIAKQHITYLTTYKPKAGAVYELTLHKDIPEGGYSMGVDNDGYFVHTHRGRSKSYEKPGDIPQKDLDFVESTG